MNNKALSEARRDHLQFLQRETRLFARRGKNTPEQKIAYAEIENALMELERRWESDGLITSQQELQLAGSAGH